MVSNTHPRLRGLLAAVLTIVAVLEFFIILTPLNEWLTLPLTINEVPQSADVIIVLGGGLKKDGSLGDIGTERVLQGAILWRDNYSDELVMSGGQVPGTPYYESQEMAGYAASLGVHYDAVYLEKQSTSTEENARFTKIIMQEHGWNDALLVTSDFHSKRACRVFRKQGFSVICVAANPGLVQRLTPVQRLHEFKSIIREYGATMYYRMKGFI